MNILSKVKEVIKLIFFSPRDVCSRWVPPMWIPYWKGTCCGNCKSLVCTFQVMLGLYTTLMVIVVVIGTIAKLL